MKTGTHDLSAAAEAASVALVGALPDAPLAMPRQRLERQAPTGRDLLALLLRPVALRADRGRG